MYIPRANEEKRIPVMQELMRTHPLATLITLTASGLSASHIPLVLEEDGVEDDGSGFGVLRGHISRANTQWRDPSPSVDALAIFAGPQHYISASWYPGVKEDGEEVPTWNYAVVHAYGPLRVIDDPVWLLRQVERLTDIHEAASPEPWKVSDAPPAFIQSQLRGIVGLEMPISRLEGKWKASQNRTDREKDAVITGLEQVDTPESLAMKRLIQSRR
jgi:transcriptional regulator